MHFSNADEWKESSVRGKLMIQKGEGGMVREASWIDQREQELVHGRRGSTGAQFAYSKAGGAGSMRTDALRWADGWEPVQVLF